ncbi:MAG: hypothetical protein Q9208_008351 [Pyrenodesmia sp. 3 TL-2023]
MSGNPDQSCSESRVIIYVVLCGQPPPDVRQSAISREYLDNTKIFIPLVSSNVEEESNQPNDQTREIRQARFFLDMMGHIVCNFVTQNSCQSVLILANWQNTGEHEYLPPNQLTD